MGAPGWLVVTHRKRSVTIGGASADLGSTRCLQMKVIHAYSGWSGMRNNLSDSWGNAAQTSPSTIQLHNVLIKAFWNRFGQRACCDVNHRYQVIKMKSRHCEPYPAGPMAKSVLASVFTELL